MTTRHSSHPLHHPDGIRLIPELQQRLEEITGNDFNTKTAEFLEEDAQLITTATQLIIRVVLTRLTTLPAPGLDSESLYQAAREFTGIDLSQPAYTYIDNGYVLIKGSGLLADLFGDHYGNTINGISVITRIKSSSTHTLISLLTCFIFQQLGLAARQHQLTAAQLTILTKRSYPEAIQWLPEDIHPFLDWMRPTTAQPPEELKPDTTVTRTPYLPRYWRLIITLSLLLLAILLIVLLSRSRKTYPPMSGSMKDALQVVGIRQEAAE